MSTQAIPAPPAPSAAPSAPPAAPPSAPSAPSSAPSSAQPASLRSMIAGDLAAARELQPAPAEGQPAAKEETVPALPEGVEPGPDEIEEEPLAAAPPEEKPAVEEQQARQPEPEEVNYEDKPEWVPQKRWDQVYPSHKFVQALKKPIEDGGIGHLPSVEDVREYYTAYADRIAMESDFAAGDPQTAAEFVNRWFGPDQQGAYRENAQTVASVLPQALSKANPQAYIALSLPVLGGYRQQMWQRWANETNPELKQALLLTAQVLENDTTGNYKQFNEQGQPIERMATDPERQRFEQERTTFQQQQARASQDRLNQWQTQIASKIDSGLQTKVDVALQSLKSVQEKAPRIYASTKKDFISEVQARVQKDAQWTVYQALVRKASRSQSPQDSEAVESLYSTMADRAISALRPSFMKEAGIAIIRQSEEKHGQLQRAASHRAPTTTGASPERQSIAPPILPRNPGEDTHTYMKRMMQADRQAAGRT